MRSYVKTANKEAPNERKLTPKQQRFVDEYLIDGNASQACIRAGYQATAANAGKIGPRLLTDKRIQAAINAQRTVTAQAQGVTQEDVLCGLKTAIEIAIDTKQTAALIRAWELLGKHLGMFVEKEQHDIRICVVWEDRELVSQILRRPIDQIPGIEQEDAIEANMQEE